jgi:hypothetical protein
MQTRKTVKQYEQQIENCFSIFLFKANSVKLRSIIVQIINVRTVQLASMQPYRIRVHARPATQASIVIHPSIRVYRFPVQTMVSVYKMPTHTHADVWQVGILYCHFRNTRVGIEKFLFFTILNLSLGWTGSNCAVQTNEW